MIIQPLSIFKFRSLIAVYILFHGTLNSLSGQELRIIVNQEGKYGYSNTSDSTVIPCVYEYAWPFYGETALVKTEEEQYLINTQGYVILSIDLSVHVEPMKNGYYTFMDSEWAGVYDSVGTVVEQTPFDHALEWMREGSSGVYLLQHGQNVGMFSVHEGIFFPTEYYVEDMSSSFNMDGNPYFDAETIFCLRRNGKWGMMNYKGEIKVPFEFDHLVNCGYYTGVSINGKYGLMDPAQKMVVAPAFDLFLATYPSVYYNVAPDAWYVFVRNDSVFFYSPLKNKWVHKLTVSKDEEGFPKAQILRCGNTYGVVSYQGEILISFTTDFLSGVDYSSYNSPNDYIMFVHEGKRGVMTVEKGVIIEPGDYTSIQRGRLDDKDYFTVKEDDRWALMDENGKMLTGFDYEYIIFYEDRISGELRKHVDILKGKNNPDPKKDK